jgi:hypothetical protein
MVYGAGLGVGAVVVFFVFFFLTSYSVLATPLLAYVAHFVFLRDVWIRTQKAAVARRRTINLSALLIV